MNRETAKLILEACRPGDELADYPDFAEAYRELERDPELKAWFVDKEKFDSLIITKLAESVHAPIDLKEKILVHAQLDANTIIFHRWFKPTLAIAAIFVVAIGVWRLGEPRDPARMLANQAIHYTSQMPRMQFVCFNASAVADWIRKQPISREEGMKITKSMKDMCLVGSSVVEWNGKPVLMLALQNEKQMAMCYVLRGDDFGIPQNANEISRNDGWVSRVSSMGGHTWVLTTKGTPDDLNFEIPF